MIGHAELVITMKTIIIGACSTDGTLEEIKELVRVIADRENRNRAKKIIGKMGMTCFWCGEKGNISRNCNQKERKCKYCERKGNVQKEKET